MNSESSRISYITMQDKILRDENTICMLVEVIAKKSQNIPWKTSVEKQPFEHANIRRVSIDKFYEIVTGDPFAFRNLCWVLPMVLDDVLASIDTKTIENSVLVELQTISPDLLKSLYLLSFSHYNGFENLGRL